jgi:hypothetical protein
VRRFETWDTAQTAVTAPGFTVTDLPSGARNLIGLARVSTDAQDAQLQQDALAATGVRPGHTEKISTRCRAGVMLTSCCTAAGGTRWTSWATDSRQLLSV